MEAGKLYCTSFSFWDKKASPKKVYLGFKADLQECKKNTNPYGLGMELSYYLPCFILVGKINPSMEKYSSAF